jgi:phosphatidylglycerophosphate synthase
MHPDDRRWTFIPCVVTGLRVAVAPLFAYTVSNGQVTSAFGLLLFAAFTDVLDGYLARKLGACSIFGAYFDATADFLFVLIAFGAFVMQGLYPAWTVLVIGGMFLQFVLTSRLGRPTYDPVGKYYGVFLFVVTGVTLILPRPVVCDVMLVGIVGLTGVSIVSRSVSLLGLHGRSVPVHGNQDFTS